MENVPKSILSSTGRELFSEMEFILLQTERPSEGIESLRKKGVLARLPQLLCLQKVPQNPKFHPEGDVWIHTMMVIDEMVRERTGDVYWDRVLGWAALCHDLGKPLSTIFQGGRWRAPGHDLAGVMPTRRLLSLLTEEDRLIEDVCKLVHDHLAPHFFAEQRVSRNSVRRLLKRLGSIPIEILVRLGRADSFGRTTTQARLREYPSGEWLLDQAARIDPKDLDGSPPPIVLGRHLQSLGFESGVLLGRILDQLYQAQLAGEFTDVERGLEWLNARQKDLNLEK